MSETAIIDGLLRHALELQRLAQGEEAKAEAILRELEGDLRAILTRRELSAANRREIAALLKEAERAIASRYINIAGVVDVDGIVQHVAERTVTVLQTGFAGSITLPGVERLASLAKDILIDGAPSSAWWAKQSHDTAFKFAAIVRRGVLNGMVNEQIVRAVVGGRGEVGLLDTSRRNARALVHSSVMTAANRARIEVMGKAFGNGFQWLATLDSNTCTICAALDGKEWDQGGKPVNHKFDIKIPPAHWNCRCVATPRRVSFNEKYGVTGADEAMATVGARPSASGIQRSGTTFDQWLDRQPAAFVEDVLGTKRAALYRQGKITLTDLITKGGRTKTLAELNAN
jgi:SPP1 gp7 family putative phage head morphogenesis protein